MRDLMLTECDDATLLARARDDVDGGGREAFGELVRRHQRAARRVAAVVSGSTEEAEDIVQEALIRVERSLESYRATGSVRSWLLRAVANQARNSRRGSMRRLRRDDLHAGLVVRVDEAAEDVALRHVEYVALAEALVELSVRDREVLGCRFVAGLSEAETSAVLDVPAGTVKSRTARALRRLEARLGDTEGGAG